MAEPQSKGMTQKDWWFMASIALNMALLIWVISKWAGAQSGTALGTIVVVVAVFLGRPLISSLLRRIK